MRWFISVAALCALAIFGIEVLSHERPVADGRPYSASAGAQNAPPAQTHLGFDRNEYPGDAALPVLRKTFAFSSYWLSVPPGGITNSWLGKRERLQAQDFGFLLLFNGRSAAEVRAPEAAEEAGLADAKSAAAAARAEGFAEGSVIFLDQEEGGRFSPEQHLYLHTWAEQLEKDHFRPGIYCSGIPVDEGGGSHITTAEDIRAHIADSEVIYWVYNDACPPSPGCGAENLPVPSASGFTDAAVWQFVRSPRDKKLTRHCHGYASDGNCYAPGDAKHAWFLDMNVATSGNPSAPR
jgi:hypothetical protein